MKDWIQKIPFVQSKPRASHLRTGLWGERVAAVELKRNGCKILGRRVRVGKHDEIDLIAKERNVMLFVEVKTRGPNSKGRPLDAVNKAKRQRLSRAVAGYLSKMQKKPPSFRCDVVEVIGRPGDKSPKIVHVKNAFQIDAKYLLQWKLEET